MEKATEPGVSEGQEARERSWSQGHKASSKGTKNNGQAARKKLENFRPSKGFKKTTKCKNKEQTARKRLKHLRTKSKMLERDWRVSA